MLGGRSGGTSDSIEHGMTGYLVAPEDVDELATYLGSLLENIELRGRLGEAGLRRARSDFSWSTRVEKLRETSANVIERERGEKSKGWLRWRPSGRDFVRSRRDLRSG